jgi:lysyl-tRNA synthetase class 2
VRISALVAVVDVLRPADPRTFGPAAVPEVVDAALDGAAFALAATSAGVMLLLAGALQRRKRRAWGLLVAVTSISVMAHLRTGGLPVVALNLVVLAMALWARQDFTAASERTARLAALRVLLVTGGVSLVGGTLLTLRAAPEASLSRRLTEVLSGLVGFVPDLKFRTPLLSDATTIALNVAGALTALLVLATLLAPARKPATLSPGDERRLRDLLARWGEQDSLGYFALRRDKAAVFSPSGKAAVVHRVVGSVTLAAGDPLGDPEAWPGAIAAWLAEAERYAWIPGVVGASESGALAYRRAGLDALELGDEAVLDLDRFCLEGRSMRAVRQATNRVCRAGYHLDVRRQRDLGPAEIAEVVRTAEELRGEEVERGFSMALSRLGDDDDPDLVVARARDTTGRLIAVLAFVPWGHDGLSLDLMRRAGDSQNGTMEFVVVGVVDWARQQGLRRMSLNFAAFRSVFERGSRVGAGPVLRAWRRVLLLASRWWQIESLYRANVKYAPEWAPRFVCFRRASDLPRVAVAALQAEALLVRPRLRWLAR